MKITYLILVGFTSVFITCLWSCRGDQSVPDFSGSWSHSTASSVFTLTLFQKGDSLTGNHCSVMQNGRRIDCAEDLELSLGGLIVDPNVVTITFRSFGTGTAGKAAIKKITDSTMEWKIIERAVGAPSIPEQVVMTKEQSPD